MWFCYEKLGRSCLHYCNDMIFEIYIYIHGIHGIYIYMNSYIYKENQNLVGKHNYYNSIEQK